MTDKPASELDAKTRRAVRLARLGTLALRVLASTWRPRYVFDDSVRALRERNEPFIYVIWHGDLLPLIYLHRGRGIVALISEHADGELIAQVVERLGYGTVRGSTSRGAARALIGLVRAARSGKSLAITPDGPRGPARSFAPGATIVAQRTGLPLVAVAIHASRAWRLRSWDRFMIPKPFATLRVAYSDALYVAPAGAEPEAETAAQGPAIMSSAEARLHG